jgi:hypothetical protein
MKAVGNHGAGQARNNQPLMGAAKAGGGWQREQEDNGWQLAMKEDSHHPVMMCRNDGTPLVGRSGSATAVLGSSPRMPSTKIAFDGGIGRGRSMVATGINGGGDGQQ